VVVRFRSSKYIPPRQVKQDLTDRQRAILKLLSEQPGIGRKKIQTILNLDVNALKSDLQRLRMLGLIRQSGKGRGTVLFLAEG